jgi:hypothetical protein
LFDAHFKTHSHRLYSVAGAALGIFVNWVANWLVAFSFPILMTFTQPYTFLIFVGTTTFFLYFTKHFVPETKGLTVSQLAVEFDAMQLCTF